MPVQDLAPEITQNEQDLEEQVERFQPGEICAVDATNDRVEISDDEDQENGFTAEEKKGCLSALASKVAQRDLVSYRDEVKDAWKARYFWRGNQHLLAGPKGQWVMPSQVLVGGQSYDDHNDETNIYLGFGDTITASLTSGLPSVRFEAEDQTDATDISAAENADKARLLIERNNNMIVLQEDIARFLWTDGRACVYTRAVIDGQRFGYSHGQSADLQDELSYLPELPGGPKPIAQDDASTGFDGTDRGTPRVSEVIEGFGVLETKLAIQANDISKSDFLQWSREVDVTNAKALYPDVADEIQPSMTPTAESEYARLARTSIMMGMRPSSLTSDSMTYNCTIQSTWVRPSFYFEENNKELRDWLWQNFPKGLMVVMAGTVFCEARNESLDDHWTLIHGRPGDGMHRPALGKPLIPLQEKLNDCMDLVHESFMHLIPITWVDAEGVDEGALSDITSAPKQYLKIQRRADKPIEQNFYTEPQIEIASGMLTYIEKLFGEFAQFLCGAFPALFGGNTGSNDTASGIASQRDQALGRVGLTWRNMKAGYARIMRQAVQAAAEHRQEIMSGTVPGSDGTDMQIAISPDDLKGNILCFPDTDENFPESWVAQRMVWMNLLEQAQKNPVVAAILAVPRNLLLAKDKIGIPEIVIPGAASSHKQMGETKLLLLAEPIPNPKLEETEQQMAMMAQQAQEAGLQIPPEAIEKAKAAVEAIPPMISTVPIGKLDDHAVETAEIRTFANSSEGIRAKAENPGGFENLMLHYDEHMAAIAELAKEQAAQAGGEPAKGPSESLSYKDLPPEGKVQLAAKGGIKLDLAKMVLEEAEAKAADAKAKAAKAEALGAAGGPGAEAEGKPVVQ